MIKSVLTSKYSKLLASVLWSFITNESFGNTMTRKDVTASSDDRSCALVVEETDIRKSRKIIYNQEIIGIQTDRSLIAAMDDQVAVWTLTAPFFVGV